MARTSGIGDYIHARTSRYIKYGISKDSPDGKNTFCADYIKARNDIVNLYSKAAKNKNWGAYSAYLNDLIYFKRKGNKTKYNTGITQGDYELVNAVIKNLANAVGDNLRNSEVLLTEWTPKTINLNKRKKNKESYPQRIRINALVDAMHSLFIAQQRAQIALLNGAIDEKDFKHIERDIADAYGEIEKVHNEMLSNNQKTIQIRKNPMEENGLTPIGKTISKANDIIRDIGTRTKALSALSGDAFEYALAAATEIAKKCVGKSAQELAKEIKTNNRVKGKNREIIALGGISTTLSADKDFKKVFLEAIGSENIPGKGWHYDKNDVLIFDKWGGTQGTVDVEISLEAESDIAKKIEIDKFYASAKNYSSSSGPTIISGTNLLTILNLLETDFVNHYLNLLSSRDGSNIVLNNSPEAKDAKNLVVFAGAIRAITGARSIGYSNSISDVLILNDKLKQQIHVVPTQDLLQGLEKSIDKIGDYVKIENFPEKFDNSWIGRKPNEGDAIRRIAYLLATVHKNKISISLKSSAVKEFAAAPTRW